MIRPMPFWPSLEPWKKLTSVQVRMRMPRIHQGGSVVALRLGIKGRNADDEFEGQQKDGGKGKAEQGRDQQCLADILGFRPIDAGCATAAMQQRVGDADADNGADEGVRTRGRQAESPGSEVPDDGRDQQRKDHRKAGVAADLQDQFDGQERDDAEGDGARGRQNAEQVERSRPDHGEVCRQRPRIDDGRYRVRSVVKAVDELEAERDQKRDEQQQEGRVARDFCAGLPMSE